MIALHTHTDRLALGARELGRRAGQAFTDCPRRELLHRVLAALFALWVVGGVVLAERRILWALLAVALIACWRTGRALERTRAAEAALVQYMRDQIGDANGVLLADVLAGLHAAEMHTAWDVHALRQVVERLGIPVRDSLKIDGAVSVGVHVDDLTSTWDVHPTPPPPPTGNPSPDEVTRDNYPTTPRVETSAGGATTTVYPTGGPAPTTTAMDDEQERQRLQAIVNRAMAAREEDFEDHLTDALGIVHGEVNDK